MIARLKWIAEAPSRALLPTPTFLSLGTKGQARPDPPSKLGGAWRSRCPVLVGRVLKCTLLDMPQR